MQGARIRYDDMRVRLLLQIFGIASFLAIFLLFVYLKAKALGFGGGWPTKTKPPQSLFGDENHSTHL